MDLSTKQLDTTDEINSRLLRVRGRMDKLEDLGLTHIPLT